jgi:hypothetical protein
MLSPADVPSNAAAGTSPAAETVRRAESVGGSFLDTFLVPNSLSGDDFLIGKNDGSQLNPFRLNRE